MPVLWQHLEHTNYQLDWKIIALHKETVQASICTGTITVCLCTCLCMCVIKNIRSDEKHTKMIFYYFFSVPQM